MLADWIVKLLRVAADSLESKKDDQPPDTGNVPGKRGPPEHWLELVRMRAPELLKGAGVEQQIGTPETKSTMADEADGISTQSLAGAAPAVQPQPASPQVGDNATAPALLRPHQPVFVRSPVSDNSGPRPSGSGNSNPWNPVAPDNRQRIRFAAVEDVRQHDRIDSDSSATSKRSTMGTTDYDRPYDVTGHSFDENVTQKGGFSDPGAAQMQVTTSPSSPVGYHPSEPVFEKLQASSEPPLNVLAKFPDLRWPDLPESQKTPISTRDQLRAREWKEKLEAEQRGLRWKG